MTHLKITLSQKDHLGINIFHDQILDLEPSFFGSFSALRTRLGFFVLFASNHTNRLAIDPSVHV